MKRRYWLLAALALIAVLILTGCTSTEQDNTADTSSGSKTGSATIAGIDSADALTETGDTENSTVSSSDISQDTVASQDGDGDAGAGLQSDAEGSDIQQSGSADEETEADDADWNVQTEDAETEDDEENSEMEDHWSGTYIGDNDTVTLQLVSLDKLSFSFDESGISGTAKIKDGQAIYEGDDQNDVVFQADGSLLSVSVVSEEDYDTSASPLNGTYIRSE